MLSDCKNSYIYRSIKGSYILLWDQQKDTVVTSAPSQGSISTTGRWRYKYDVNKPNVTSSTNERYIQLVHNERRPNSINRPIRLALLYTTVLD